MILTFRGDLIAIKRIAIEFCEDAAKNGILYVESRFCPHLMLSERAPEVTAKHVLQTVLEGFKESEERLGIKVCDQICCTTILLILRDKF